jgi:hypothetical protein
VRDEQVRAHAEARRQGRAHPSQAGMPRNTVQDLAVGPLQRLVQLSHARGWAGCELYLLTRELIRNGIPLQLRRRGR